MTELTAKTITDDTRIGSQSADSIVMMISCGSAASAAAS
jgi:hypothetical protein